MMAKHQGVSCDVCQKNNFQGKRYKCLICYDYDLCANCYTKQLILWQQKKHKSLNCYNNGTKPLKSKNIKKFKMKFGQYANGNQSNEKSKICKDAKINLNLSSASNSNKTNTCAITLLSNIFDDLSSSTNYIDSSKSENSTLYNDEDYDATLAFSSSFEDEDNLLDEKIGMGYEYGTTVAGTSSDEINHDLSHPMQCILTLLDFDICYGGPENESGSAVISKSTMVSVPSLSSDGSGGERSAISNKYHAHTQSYTCPFCGKLGFSSKLLYDHVINYHPWTRTEILCPICAGNLSRDPNCMTQDFSMHFNFEHNALPRNKTASHRGPHDTPGAVNAINQTTMIFGSSLGGLLCSSRRHQQITDSSLIYNNVDQAFTSNQNNNAISVLHRTGAIRVASRSRALNSQSTSIPPLLFSPQTSLNSNTPPAFGIISIAQVPPQQNQSLNTRQPHFCLGSPATMSDAFLTLPVDLSFKNLETLVNSPGAGTLSHASMASTLSTLLSQQNSLNSNSALSLLINAALDTSPPSYDFNHSASNNPPPNLNNTDPNVELQEDYNENQLSGTNLINDINFTQRFEPLISCTYPQIPFMNNTIANTNRTYADKNCDSDNSTRFGDIFPATLGNHNSNFDIATFNSFTESRGASHTYPTKCSFLPLSEENSEGRLDIKRAKATKTMRLTALKSISNIRKTQTDDVDFSDEPLHKGQDATKLNEDATISLTKNLFKPEFYVFGNNIENELQIFTMDTKDTSLQTHFKVIQNLSQTINKIDNSLISTIAFQQGLNVMGLVGPILFDSLAISARRLCLMSTYHISLHTTNNALTQKKKFSEYLIKKRLP